MRAAAVCTLAILAAAPASIEPSAPESMPVCAAGPRASAEIESLLADLMAEQGYPGFSYAIAAPQGQIAAGGVGIADRETRARMRTDTIFQVGSITKTFTGALLARLVAEDRIELGDPLSAHWFVEGEVPTDAQQRSITIQAVATHTAGLPHYPANLDRQDGDPILGYSLAQMREALAALSIEAEFPLSWSYSNFGYGVLAQAIGRSQAQDFGTLLRQRILDPARLLDTGFHLTAMQQTRLATPYRDDDTSRATTPWRMGAMSAAGGLFSTAGDLAQFGAWLLRDSADGADDTEIEAALLQQAPLVRLGRTTSYAYGLGIFVVDDYVEGVDVNWHGGDVDGYAGALLLLPDHDLAFAYLTNIGFANGFSDFQQKVTPRLVAHCGESARRG